MATETGYLWDQILRHARAFYTAEGYELLRSAHVTFCPLGEATAAHRAGIVIPVGAAPDTRPREIIEAPFADTTLRLWSRLPTPDPAEWTAWPSESHPLWYRHREGALLAAWTLFDTLFDLLTFGEEARIQRRDHHGRFVGDFSPRAECDLLEEPVFNAAVALLVGAAAGLSRSAAPTDQIGRYVRPPRVVLSHDCDQLRGNDRWTQAVRLYRVVEPLGRFRPPRLQNLWWAARNAARPRDFYLDNIKGIVTLERMFNCHSTFYLINGTGGRYGARSGSKLIPAAAAAIPDGWEAGVHYNYDTHLDRERLSAQIAELEGLVDRPMRCGRAHYLRFDPHRSFPLYEECGIEVDESAGYTDRIGYRCGIAGCFKPWDRVRKAVGTVTEVPMTVMEATLIAQYGEAAAAKFELMLRHLAAVGGALTLVLHVGQFFNPELVHGRHFYHRLLRIARDRGAEAQTAPALAREFDKPLPG